jgi:hypothetical protein
MGRPVPRQPSLHRALVQQPPTAYLPRRLPPAHKHAQQLACKKHCVHVFEFSPCLSHACLGKRSFSIKLSKQKTFLSVLFLCLSRACLGKMIIFSACKRWTQAAFRTHVARRRVHADGGGERRQPAVLLPPQRERRLLGQRLFLRKTPLSFLSAFPYACPEPVLAK